MLRRGIVFQTAAKLDSLALGKFSIHDGQREAVRKRDRLFRLIHRGGPMSFIAFPFQYLGKERSGRIIGSGDQSVVHGFFGGGRLGEWWDFISTGRIGRVQDVMSTIFAMSVVSR